MANLISIGQVFDKTVDHYKKHFTELISLSGWIVAAAVPAALGKFIEPFAGGDVVNAIDWIAIILKGAGGILLTVASIMTLIMIIKAVADQANGVTRNHANELKIAKRTFFPYIWVSILFGLIALASVAAPIIGLILLIISSSVGDTAILSVIGTIVLLLGIPVAFILMLKFSIQYAFAPYSLVLEEEPKAKTMTAALVFSSGLNAMKDSSALVKGRWWGTFFRFLIPQVIYALMVSIVNFLALSAFTLLIAITLGASPIGVGFLGSIWFLISMCITALLTPLVAVTDFYIYDSLRKTR